MQVTSFCLFMLVCSYTLINAAPINNAPAETHESKQQKAHVIANRLLKELAGEHVESPSIVQAPINAESGKDAAAPADRPATEKVETHVESPAAEDSYDEDNQDLELTPTIDDLFELYNDKYNQLYEDDETPIDDDEIDGDDDDDEEDLFPITRQELLRYLADQEDTNEQSVPTSHAPVMDDTIMTAEEHHQQRRRRSA